MRRRRQCLSCAYRFTTFERVEEVPLVVVKSDGSTQPFDRDKIVFGVRAASKGRSVSEEQIQQLALEVEDEIRLGEWRGQLEHDRARRARPAAPARRGRLPALRLGLQELRRRLRLPERARAAEQARHPARRLTRPGDQLRLRTQRPNTKLSSSTSRWASSNPPIDGGRLVDDAGAVAADHARRDRQVELVDEIVGEQRGVERRAALGLDEAAPRGSSRSSSVSASARSTRSTPGPQHVDRRLVDVGRLRCDHEPGAGGEQRARRGRHGPSW